MDQRDYVYVSIINTTPEKLWSALTGQPFWRQFSGPVETDWKTGSPIRFYLPDGKLYAEGIVRESTPPFHLSLTWPDPAGEQSPATAARLTFHIESNGPDAVKLTLTHEKLTEQAYQGVSRGWPTILETLKSWLEPAAAENAVETQT